MTMVLLSLIASALWFGLAALQKGWRSTVAQCVQFVLVLLLALAVAGFVVMLLPQTLVEQWLDAAQI